MSDKSNRRQYIFIELQDKSNKQCSCYVSVDSIEAFWEEDGEYKIIIERQDIFSRLSQPWVITQSSFMALTNQLDIIV